MGTSPDQNHHRLWNLLRLDLNPKTASRKLWTPIFLGAETQMVGICLEVHSWLGGPRLPSLQRGALPVRPEMREVGRALH